MAPALARAHTPSIGRIRLATERDAATAESSAAPASEDASDETDLEKVARESGEWKAKFDASQGRLRVANANAGHAAESEERTIGYITKALTEFAKIDDPQERIQRIQELERENTQARELSTRITNTQVDLDKLISDGKLDWANDPDLAAARAAWEGNKPEEALRLASLLAHERALKDSGYVSSEEVEEIVETKLRNARQDDSNVDTDTASAPRGTPEVKPTNPEEAVAYMRDKRLAGGRMNKQERADLVRGASGR